MEETTAPETSVFQTKYNEFVEDLMGAVPEYAVQISLGENPYYVFLDSLDKKDYVYIKND
jgi:hypothetical protein